jgi:tRNA pseudouridine65 synthase
VAPELPVLYRDDTLLIVDKPAGLVVHRGWADDELTALDLARRVAGTWVYPLHRLDRGTSGALCFALSPVVARTLQEQLEAGSIEKRYLALVRGTPPAAELIDHPLAKEKGKPKLPAQTRIARLATYRFADEASGITRSYSWVEAFPLTGRVHQIRRHLKHLNHPIIGDVRYGRSELNRLFRRRFGLERTALHAERLSLSHPVHGAPLIVTAPLAAELRQMLASLERCSCAPE